MKKKQDNGNGVKNKREKIKILVILGPTASGKSDLAVALARKYSGEVVSADSRQVYKGLDIGTGKITKKEMQGIPHHLLDVVSPKTQFSAHDFVKLAQKAIEDIDTRGKLPIVCGGTGFYISALLGETKLSEVPINKKLRKELEQKSASELFKILQKLDPKRSKGIDKHNPHRLVRAIEIARAYDKHKQLPNSKKQIPNKYGVMKIGLTPVTTKPFDISKGFESKNKLNTILKLRIEERLKKRLKQGMIAEAKSLHRQGVSYKRMRELGLEYKHLADLLQNKIGRKEFEEKLVNDIYHYAKRQMTWFKRPVRHTLRSDASGVKDTKWFRPKDFENIKKLVEKFI